MTEPLSQNEPVEEAGMCHECGAPAGDAYHPYAFCVLVKAGLDPWATIREMAADLGLGDPGKEPQKLTEVWARERTGA